jgi:hypothetical protein
MTGTPQHDQTTGEEPEGSEPPQVSEVRNLENTDENRGLQIEEGVPPASAARQEAQGPPYESEGNAVRSTPRPEDV